MNHTEAYDGDGTEDDDSADDVDQNRVSPPLKWAKTPRWVYDDVCDDGDNKLS